MGHHMESAHAHMVALEPLSFDQIEVAEVMGPKQAHRKLSERGRTQPSARCYRQQQRRHGVD